MSRAGPLSRVGRAAALFLASALPLAAEDAVDGTGPRAFEAICRMTETCVTGRGCVEFPAPGELLLVWDGAAARLGPSRDLMRPVDRFARLEDALPLPDIGAGRRNFLVDAGTGPLSHRFGLYVQTSDAEGAPALMTRHFMLDCDEIVP